MEGNANRLRISNLQSKEPHQTGDGDDADGGDDNDQGCISCGTCSCPELTEDHVLTSAYVKIFRTVTRNAVNKSFGRKKDCS